MISFRSACTVSLIASATMLAPLAGCSGPTTMRDAAIPPGDGAVPASEPCRNALYEGAALPEGTTIVVCGLAPGSELVDVVGSVVYTASPRAVFVRHDTATGAHTRLYQTFANERTASYVDGQIVFDGWLGVGETTQSGMLAISADVPTPDDGARLLSEAIDYFPGGRVLADGLQRYVGESGRGSVLALDVASGRTRRVVDGTAIGLSTSWLYYCDDTNEVRRIRRDGSEDQWLAPAAVPTPHCAAEVRAVDEDGIYLTRQDAPYEIWHFGPEGRETFVGTTSDGDVEVPIAPAARLFVDGPWVYALRQPSGVHGADSLTRVAVGRDEQYVISGTDVGPPRFRDGALYVALTRDGLDGPVDGVVVRIDLATR